MTQLILTQPCKLTDTGPLRSRKLQLLLKGPSHSYLPKLFCQHFRQAIVSRWCSFGCKCSLQSLAAQSAMNKLVQSAPHPSY